jgi:DNA-binding transcriptional ArsR family regulator
MVDKTDILDFDKKYGFTQTPNILVANMAKLRISGNEFVILTIIRMFAHQKDNSFPSIRTLKKISGMSISTIERLLSGLEKKGYLIIVRKSNSKNLYSFKPLNELLEKIMFVEHNKSRDLNRGVSILDTPVSILDTGVSILDTEEEEEEEEYKNKITHTSSNSSNMVKGVCEDEIQKIQKSKTFQNSDTGLIKNLIKKNGKEAIIAAEYINKTFSGQAQAVRNPIGLLISTLERGTYSELPAAKINNLNLEIGRLNAEYKGFTIFRNEKIKEFLNIGGRIAFNTDNCLREIIYTPAKSCEEFKNYLQKINSS